jgi:murein endopeptidase
VRALSAAFALLCLLAVAPVAAAAFPDGDPAWGEGVERLRDPAVHWKRSAALGTPHAGRLVDGIRLPPYGRDFFTWDPVLDRAPNRPWRRYGTDRLVRTVLRVLAGHRAAHPEAPRIGIGDLSRPRGGPFGAAFGGLGHVSHQNGLDVDVYYPRRDRREREPADPRQIDRRLAQDLLDRFLQAGASRIYVGPQTGLRGPGGIVRPAVHHEQPHARPAARAAARAGAARRAGPVGRGPADRGSRRRPGLRRAQVSRGRLHPGR